MSGNVARERPTGLSGASKRADKCIIEVAETELPPVVVELSDEYDRCIGDRDRFLWKWIFNLFDAFTLSCVPEEQWESVKSTKTVLTMFVTVLDDLADRRGDGATFEQAQRIPNAPAAIDRTAEGVDEVVLDFAERLWDTFRNRLIGAPRSAEFDDLLSFDIREVLTAMEYARVLNDVPAMANLEGTRHYGPHNMVMFPYADVDLMYSRDFDVAELGELRGLIWELQRMARIGNWVTTWERELHEADYSAGIVVDALERGVIDPEMDAAEAKAEAIDRIKSQGIERKFRREWRERFDRVQRRKYDVESVDVDGFVDGMRTVMNHHLASYGYK